MIEHFRECRFEAKPDGKRGCAKCNLAKGHRAHFGRPESFNEGGSGTNWHAYQGKKRALMSLLSTLIEGTGLPRGLGRVQVEGKMVFGRRPGAKGPDQGNFRFPLEKALGDALEDGGWLVQDDWTRYQFGNLEYDYLKDVDGFRLMLFPSWPEPEPTPDGQLDLASC